MTRDFPQLALESVDPWEKIQLDPATRRLAEQAAAAAGLAIEDWLERAIRRACPSAFRAAAVTVPVAPSTNAQPPQPSVLASAPAQPSAIDTSLAALLATTQQRVEQMQTTFYAPRPESAETRPATPALPPLPTTIADETTPATPSRLPTLAERLAQRRLDSLQEEAADASALAATEASSDRDGPHEKHDGPMLVATRDQIDESAGESSHLEEAQPQSQPQSRQNRARFALLAAAIVLAVTTGAVIAQYVIPGHSRALAPPSDSRLALVPPSSASPLPSVENGAANSSDVANASSAPVPDVPSAPAPPAPPSIASSDSSNTGEIAAASTDLSPNPALSAPPESSAPTDLASSRAPSVSPASLPAPSNDEATTAPTPLAAKPDLPTPAEPTPPAVAAATKPVTPEPPLLAPASAAPTKTASAAIPPRPTKDEVAPTDPKALAAWLEQRAKSGDAIAQYRLGVLYALGQGVQQDYQRAAEFFRASAEGGVAEAQYNIAVMFGEELGIGHDPVQAVHWYRKAAAQGNANAAFNLGVAYSNGVGVQQQSMDQAAQWFRRAAAAGIINAQFNLGLLYERGDGVPVSQVDAYAWYSAAAAGGDAGAAQRRDRLASTLAPATLREAQARAQQIATTIHNSSDPDSGGFATGAATKAAAQKN